MADNTILIKNALILNPNFQNKKQSLLIKDDLIAEIADEIDESNADKIIDAEGKILLPGLINTHTHLSMTLFRGLADDLSLDSWLNDHIWPMEANLNGDYCYISYGASISSCNGNNKANAHYKIGYRVHNTGDYQYITLANNLDSYSASGMLYTDGIFAADRGSGTKLELSSLNTYDIQFYVDDTFNPNGQTNTQQLDTGFDLMNFNPSGKAMAIGKVSEASANEELFEVGIDTDIDGTLSISGIPTLRGNAYGDIVLSSASGNGGWLYFRPNGINDSSGQMTLDQTGKLTINGETIVIDGGY